MIGLPVCDMISEGNIGLMHALKRFDPNKGVRFSTYAIWWIKAAIQDYVMRSRSLVKMGTTRNQKKLYFNLSKAKHRLSATQQADLYANQVTLIANELGVKEHDVVEMNRRLSGDISLNVPLNEDGNSVEWQDRLVDDGSDQESAFAESEQTEVRRKVPLAGDRRSVKWLMCHAFAVLLPGFISSAGGIMFSFRSVMFLIRRW